MDERLVAIQAALRALPEGREQSESCLKPLVTELPTATKRTSLSKKLQLRVYRRDNLSVGTVGGKMCFILRLSTLPSSFRRHCRTIPNWKRSETHPLFYEITTTCDHVIPVSRGGSNDETNLVAACARCQYMKSDWSLKDVGWTLHEPEDSDWDGLTELFLLAFRAHPVDDQNLKNWVAALAR